MTASERVIRFIRHTFDTALYFAVMAVKENFRNYVGRAGTVGVPKSSILILGNGPSLAEDLPRLIDRGEHLSKDVMTVNFFAEDARFETVRPAYYVLSDPMFFRDSVCRERVAALYRALNEKVAWPMNLYVQFYNPERFDYRAALPNPNIRIVPFHTQLYRGFRGLEFRLFRRGLGSANFGTVVQVGEYVALLLGYRTLELYGVDHTLLDGLCVDEANRLCRIDRHYYDIVEPEPVSDSVSDSVSVADAVGTVAGRGFHSGGRVPAGTGTSGRAAGGAVSVSVSGEAGTAAEPAAAESDAVGAALAGSEAAGLGTGLPAVKPAVAGPARVGSDAAVPAVGNSAAEPAVGKHPVMGLSAVQPAVTGPARVGSDTAVPAVGNSAAVPAVGKHPVTGLSAVQPAVTGLSAAVPQPIFQKVPPVPYTMAVYLAEVAELFRGHEVLRDYAAWLGARIVNRTRGSMIDAYERMPAGK